jgi:hypothetical protein
MYRLIYNTYRFDENLKMQVYVDLAVRNKRITQRRKNGSRDFTGFRDVGTRELFFGGRVLPRPQHK